MSVETTTLCPKHLAKLAQLAAAQLNQTVNGTMSAVDHAAMGHNMGAMDHAAMGHDMGAMDHAAMGHDMGGMVHDMGMMVMFCLNKKLKFSKTDDFFIRCRSMAGIRRQFCLISGRRIQFWRLCFRVWACSCVRRFMKG